MVIRSELAAPYNYGTQPQPGDQWWRPITFSHSTSVTVAYTSEDFGKDGITGNVTMSNDQNPPETPEFAITGDAVQRLPSMCMYEIEYNIDYAH